MNHNVSKSNIYAHLTQTSIILERVKPHCYLMSTLVQNNHSQSINVSNENHLQKSEMNKFATQYNVRNQY